MRFVAALLVTALSAGAASADDAAAPADAPQTITAPVVAPAAEAEPEFDPYLQPVKNAQAASEAEQLQTRRTYLKVHQAAGLTALGLLVGQVVVGQMMMNKRELNEFDDEYENLKDAHLALGIATFSAYSVAGGAAILAPKVVDRTGVWDTVSVHKGFALIHGTGMILTPLLGIYNARERDRLAKDPKATLEDWDRLDERQDIHQFTGYTTAVALPGAMLSVTLR